MPASTRQKHTVNRETRIAKKLIETIKPIKPSQEPMLMEFRSRAGCYSQRGAGGLDLKRDARQELADQAEDAGHEYQPPASRTQPEPRRLFMPLDSFN